MRRLQLDGYALVPDMTLPQVLSIASLLGDVTMDKRSPELYRRISPQPFENAKEKTLSSRYGMGAFPFHTDAAHWRCPAAYVLLFCENPGQAKRPTNLIDTYAWQIDDRLQHSMRSDLWKSGYRLPMLCTVGEEVRGLLSIRYDTDCMRPASAKSERLRLQLETLIAESAKIGISWVHNALLIVDNARMLHARGGARLPDEDRVLIRILVGGRQ
jgi:L-asparagine oxygenase